MELKTDTVHNIQILEISGRFDINTASAVRDWFEVVTRIYPVNIVVDMAGVPFIDSSALATLVQGMKRVREKQGDIHLSDLQQPVRIVLELTRLDKVFEIYPSKQDAIMGFYRSS